MPKFKINFFTALFLLLLFFIRPVSAIETPSWVEEILNQVNFEIKKYAMPGGVVGFSMKDLNSGVVVSQNADMAFPPASVIKLAVMVKAFQEEANGKLSFKQKLVLRRANKLPGSGSLQYARCGGGYTIESLIKLMITDSDNTATHMLITKLGKENINKYMQEIGLKNTVIKDLTLFQKKPGLCNISTPEDMLFLMDKMYNKTLVNAEASTKMLEIMTKQLHRWGIPKLLPPGLMIANKTGSLDYVRNDVGIIMDNNNPYIISIFAKELPSNSRGTALIGSISKAVYDIRANNQIN
jgi:beta-lactamase class A